MSFADSSLPVRNDSLHVSMRNSPQRSLSLQAGPAHVRPLPPIPPLRIAPKRRASGGVFLNETPRPPPPRTQRFHVSNPNDSPVSPSSPQYPPLALNITPATPLPPPTPVVPHDDCSLRPVRDHATLDIPLPTEKTGHARGEKRDRRLARSVGSVPDHVLAELRGMKTPFPTEVPSIYRDTVADESNELSEEEEYSWVVQTATRVVRPAKNDSVPWTEDLGGDRWISDHYSFVLRAL